MTNHIDPDKLTLARDYAAWITARDPHRKDARAAAEVIAALPETIVDGDELRGIMEGIEDGDYDVQTGRGVSGIRSDIESLLPTPTSRTLADMTPEEREACQWMQADYLDKNTGRTTRVIITRADQHVTDIVFPSGVVSCVYNDELTTLRPDLPRMVWPDEQAPEEDMSIIPSKIDTSTGHDDDEGMAPEDVPSGEPWIVQHRDREWIGCRNDPGTRLPWLVIGRDHNEFEYCYDDEVTLVSRLVPEVKA